MIVRGIAKRYAVALFNTAVREDITEQVDGDAQSFALLLAENEPFTNFLHSPQVLTSDKVSLLQQVLGERASGLFVRFVMLLLHKKRLNHLQEMADAFHFMFEQQQGIVEARVITAVPLEPGLETKTIRRLEEETNKQIRLETAVDPNIIGGMIIILEDKIIDGSVRNHLDTMRKSLSEVKVH